ncbi:MAG TPA: segregation/condensation protein A [Gemmataceae bacterium]|nr:segregation/condensation protein A [Gemmataceae bacterium]
MDDYQVDLDSFRGPLDLLLYLVKHNEVDVCDIPIARILEQFQHYLDVMTVLDVERVGDFIVMAGTLMEIKSKMVLPRGAEESAEEEGDPRRELVRQLIEYKKFKDAAALLEAQGERQALRLPRQPVPPPSAADPSRQPLQQVELWDLVSAFGRLMRETLALQPQQIVVDHTPIHVYMELIVRRLESEGPLPLGALFTPPYNRGRLVGLFLAMLELIKGRRVLAEQAEPFAEIRLSLAPFAPESPPG